MGLGDVFYNTLRIKMNKKIVPRTQLCYSEIHIFFFALLKLLTFFFSFGRLKKKHLDV